MIPQRPRRWTRRSGLLLAGAAILGCGLLGAGKPAAANSEDTLTVAWPLVEVEPGHWVQLGRASVADFDNYAHLVGPGDRAVREPATASWGRSRCRSGRHLRRGDAQPVRSARVSKRTDRATDRDPQRQRHKSPSSSEKRPYLCSESSNRLR